MYKKGKEEVNFRLRNAHYFAIYLFTLQKACGYILVGKYFLSLYLRCPWSYTKEKPHEY